MIQQATGHARLFEEILGVRRTDNAVQVFESCLVLHQNDQVVILLFQHLFVAAKAGVDSLHGGHVLLLQIGEHNLKDAGQRHGIIHGAVVVKGLDFQMFVDGIQFIVMQAGEQRLRHGQGVNIGVGKIHPRLIPCFTDEQHIKAVGVVGNQDVIAAEFLELADGLGRCGGIGHHAVVDAGQLHHLLRDGLAGVDEGTETLIRVDLAVFHVHGADLGQSFHVGVQAGGLGIKHHKGAGDGHGFGAIHSGDHIVHKVGFTPIDQLEVGVILVDLVSGKHGFRVALAHAVVGNGNGAVAHAVGQAHDLAGIAEAVHAAGLGMQMQFHALLPLGGIIMAGHTLHLQYIIGQQDIVVLVLIVGIVAAHDEGCAGFEALPLRHILVFIAEDFEVDGTVIVGDGGKVDFAAVALYLGKEYVAPHSHLAAIAQIVQRAQVGRLERLAIEHLSRLGGELQPLNGKGCHFFFGLELHGGHLFCHVAVKFVRIHLFADQLHAHNGQSTGALLDEFCQMPGQLHAFQNRQTRVDPHHKTVLSKSNRLGFIQKAVDRHPLLFELFDHSLDGFRRDGVIVEVVAHGQLITGKNLLQ